jgi:hypothetical protein
MMGMSVSLTNAIWAAFLVLIVIFLTIGGYSSRKNTHDYVEKNHLE